MESMIYFYEQPDPRRLADAVAAAYSIPRDQIGVVVNGNPLPGTVDRPLAQVTFNPETEVESAILETGDRFSETTGVRSELELALELCRAMETAAVFSAPGLPEDHWMLVTAAGGHGEVAVDPDESDEGRIRIVGLRHPIEGAPNAPVL
ncbi:hypothetical protein GCM10029992_12930 [Glycomyces albus]